LEGGDNRMINDSWFECGLLICKISMKIALVQILTF